MEIKTENKITKSKRLADYSFEIELSTENFGVFSLIMHVDSSLICSEDGSIVYPLINRFDDESHWEVKTKCNDWIFFAIYIVEDAGEGKFFVVTRASTISCPNFRLRLEISQAIKSFMQEKLNENIKYF